MTFDIPIRGVEQSLGVISSGGGGGGVGGAVGREADDDADDLATAKAVAEAVMAKCDQGSFF